jgi:hemerythrin
MKGLAEFAEKRFHGVMEATHDPAGMENRYEQLRSTLHELSDVLVHSGDEELLLELFRHAQGSAAEMFQEEEHVLRGLDDHMALANRQGHQRFLKALEEIQREAQGQRLGIHAAGLLRRELLPWLHEHHAVVDRQLLERSFDRSSDFPGNPFHPNPG